MNRIKRKIDVEIKLTIEDIANQFCDMDGDQQAEFFSLVAKNVGKWDSAFCFQAQYITDSKKLTNGGRGIMRVIGEYSEKI